MMKPFLSMGKGFLIALNFPGNERWNVSYVKRTVFSKWSDIFLVRKAHVILLVFM